MKKRILIAIVCALCLLLGIIATGCGEKEQTSSSSKKKDLTLNGVGMLYGKDDYKPMTKIRTLNDIYFPEGILDTGLGMWIYDNAHNNWVRTNSEEGRALFQPYHPTFISTHGMGGGAFADDPENFYAAGYNVLSFLWGTYADENNENVDFIVDKVWLYDYDWYETSTKTYHEGSRWLNVDEEWVVDDPSDASVIEMYCAYYYDFFSHFSNYSGSSIELFGHSYGGMISIGATSLLTTAYKCGLLEAYMLPDYVTLLDPYFMRCYETSEVAWLGENTPKYGNIAEIAYQTSLDCQKLGIAVRMFRFTKSVAFPATMWYFSESEEYPWWQGDFGTSYWKFINNIVYAHLSDNTVSIFGGDMGAQHNYAWDWYTEYYTGKTLHDALATKTEEQAFCFKMDYDVSFARMGIKYNVDLNDTLDNTDDDLLYSFFREYKYDGPNGKYPNSDTMRSEKLEELADLHGNAKIAGFIYLDQNKNGVMDERIKDHLSGAKVTITDAEGTVIYSETTTINGYYEVEVETEGTYTVTVELPKGYDFSSEKTSAEVTIVDAYYQLAMNNFGATTTK